jgi:hypothetical protein
MKNMNEDDIIRIIDDEAHLRSLHRKVGGRRRFRRWWTLGLALAAALLVAIPAAFSTLPHRDQDQTACNRDGEWREVRNCADQLLTTLPGSAGDTACEPDEQTTH